MDEANNAVLFDDESYKTHKHGVANPAAVISVLFSIAPVDLQTVRAAIINYPPQIP